MKKIYYNKLIRDNIPNRIKETGGDYEIVKLKIKEFEEELIKKISEESSELFSAKNREEFISELADVIDVIDELRELKGISDNEIKNAQEKSFKKKGGFKKRLFLKWASDTGYEANKNK